MRTHKQVLSAIQNIAITGKGLDAAIQSVGLDVIQHVEQNGEVSLAIKLLRALPKGSRSNALADWFQKFSKVAVNTDKATAKQFPLVFNKAGKLDVEGATKLQWFQCKPEKAMVDEFDFNAKLLALLNQASKAEKDGITIKGADALKQARAMLKVAA